MTSGETARPIRVLLSMAGPDGTTKFVDQLVAQPGNVQHAYFSWGRALFGRYDIFHVHWPESLVRSRSGAVRIARRLATAALLVRLRLGRVRVVRTVHNSKPHRPGDRMEARLVDALDRRVSMYVCLNELTPTRPGATRVVIPHGSYHEPFAHHPRSTRRHGLLFFGRIDAYKGVDDLVQTFTRLNDPNLTLRVVGQPHGDVSTTAAAAAADPRISLALEFIPDDALVREVTGAELAVLPYRHLENSGVVFVALSLGTPVLAPYSPTIALLRDEFGHDWIRLYDGALSTQTIEDALRWARQRQGVLAPAMTDRDWRTVGARHEAVYRAVLNGGGA